MTDLVLRGCRPQPLSHYLKALGLFRAVVEQGADPGARASWRGDHFVLTTALSREALHDFLLRRWSPTPILAPWNGGSGFFPKDNQAAIRALRDTPAPRLAGYREAIEAASALLEQLGIREKPGPKEKDALLVQLRSRLPDPAIRWLDTAVLLTREETRFPPLTGTGGNDGRLEFSRNFMERVIELIDPESGAPQPGAERLLEGALHGEPIAGLNRDAASGQFLPAISPVNPWDFALMIEGTLLFTAAATRRMEQAGPGELIYPFMVRPSGVGYGSAAASDEGASRAELWAPLWEVPIGLAELGFLFGEGRARVGRRGARDGVDFARALVSLGTARGLTGFVRYAFQERKGLAYIATPLGHFAVGDRPRADLLGPIDRWLDDFGRGAQHKNAPASLRRAHRRLQGAILELARGGGWTEVLIALGAAEAAMDRSRRFTREQNLSPVPWLRRSWLGACAAECRGEVAFALARALAARGVRHRLVQGRRSERGRFVWAPETDRRKTWAPVPLSDNLLALLQREQVERSRDGAGRDRPGREVAELDEVLAFVRGAVDEERLEALLRGLVLIRPRGAEAPPPDILERAWQLAHRPALPYTYGLLKLLERGRLSETVRIPPAPEVLRQAAAGQRRALVAAHRRLVGAGLRPLLSPEAAPDTALARSAAATAFPLAAGDLARIARGVLRRPETL